MDFSFCESVHASGISPWHIRRLTEVGRKLGGGIDTHSLCGLVKNGWDLQVPMEGAERHQRNGIVCSGCWAAYKSQP